MFTRQFNAHTVEGLPEILGTREQKKNTTWEQKLLEAYFKEREQQNRRNTFRKHRNTRPIFERTREHAPPPPTPHPPGGPHNCVPPGDFVEQRENGHLL